MIRKTVEFATPGTRLSVANRQLVVERPEHPKATLPIEDLGVAIHVGHSDVRPADRYAESQKGLCAVPQGSAG